MSNFQKEKFLIILISPSGGGKSTIAQNILSKREDIAYSVSFTTRPPRGMEVNGKDYNFISKDEFFNRKAKGDFLESALVHDYYYATSISFIQKMINEGQHVIMDIDVQGALQLMKSDFPAVTVFILPPSEIVLKERLIARGTDNNSVISTRLKNAKMEISHISEFDYLVINDDLSDVVNDVNMIISVEENRVKRYSKIKESFYGG